MKVITFDGGIKKEYLLEKSPTTFADLQASLRTEHGVHVNWAEKTVQLKPGNVQLVDISDIPDTDIILFIFPVDTKGGTTRKELETIAKEASSTPTGKIHFKGYTSMPVGDLIAKVDGWKKLNAKPTKAKKVREEKVSSAPKKVTEVLSTENTTVNDNNEAVKSIVNVVQASVDKTKSDVINSVKVVKLITNPKTHKAAVTKFVNTGKLPVDQEAIELEKLQSDYNKSKTYFGGRLKKR